MELYPKRCKIYHFNNVPYFTLTCFQLYTDAQIHIVVKNCYLYTNDIHSCADKHAFMNILTHNEQKINMSKMEKMPYILNKNIIM